MASAPQEGTLHIHLDESGDLVFSPNGTRFYVFAAVWTYDPAPLASDLVALRFRLLKQGLNIERFHATDDHPATRDSVIQRLVHYPAWRFAAIVIEKRKVPPGDQEPRWRFYSRFACVPVRFILRSPVRAKANKVLIYTDRLPQEVHRESTEKAIKKACHQELSKPMARIASRKPRVTEEIHKILHEKGDLGPDVGPAARPIAETTSVVAGSPCVPFCVYHHASASNPWLQVADYCSWIIQSKWERSDATLFGRFKRHLAAPECDILKDDTNIYY